MMPQVLDFIPGLLEDTDDYILVADGHHVKAKQKGQVRIKMCGQNGNTFITTLHNVIFAPDLCNRLFSFITLINFCTYLIISQRVLYSVLFSQREKCRTLPHIAERKHDFLEETKQISKTKKLPSRKKIALELLHKRLGHKSTKSLLSGNTTNV